MVDSENHQSVEQKEVMVSLGHRVELLFTLATGAFEESIEVVGTPPVIDYTAVSTGLDVDSAMLDEIPIGRQLSWPPPSIF